MVLVVKRDVTLKQMIAEVKKLRLPITEKSDKPNEDRMRYYWSKNRGHAGANTVDRVLALAKKYKYKEDTATTSGSPDGNNVGYTTVLTNGVFTLYTNKHYGPTADYNHFSIGLGVK